MEMFRSSVRLTTLALFAFSGSLVAFSIAGAQSPRSDSETQLASTGSAGAVNHTITQAVERMEMLVKSSSILTLEAKIPRFQVHNEEVLGATPISQNQLQVYAKTPGTTQINLWDTNDNQYTVDITVIADAREIEGILASQLPQATLKVIPVNTSAIVSGYVTSVDDVDRAMMIVEQYYPNVVNNIRVVGVQQVLLHTRIMEVSRTKLRELGVDFTWSQAGERIVSAPGGRINTAGTVTGSATNVFSGVEFTTLIQALRQQNLVKFLAEPTVVATHGRPARFNVGGRVPYVVISGNGAPSVDYEEFGTSVDFLPFVIGPGRVRLEVRPEVKEIDPTLQLTVQGSAVPGFSARYVETAVELQAGQTFAIAGLLQSRTEASSSATPILGELPVIGTWFRSVRDRRNDVELLITVTPDVVGAMDPHQVPRGGPGLNSMNPNDRDLYWEGHIEVPNLLGGDGCNINGTPSNSGPQSMIHTNIMQHGATTAHGNLMSESAQMPAGMPASAELGLPPGAIIPTSEPTEVGEGVIVSTPDTF